jgi:hypothetical protein
VGARSKATQPRRSTRGARCLTLAAAVTCLSLYSAAFVGRVSAHGPPPAAAELLAVEEQQASLVRLTTGGLAQRVTEGFRFVCPEAWGGDVLAPAAAIPLGPTVLGSDTLFVLEADGRLAAHPVQSGTARVLVSQRDAVFGLFQQGEQTALRRVTPSENDLIRNLDRPFGALAALDEELVLLHWLDKALVLERVAPTGELLGSVSMTLPNAVAYARLRVAAGRLYVVVWGRSAPWVTLGRITDGTYEPLREAGVDIAGPVATTDGSLVAVDGVLLRLDDGAPVDTGGERITCLGESAGEPYACAHGDLLRVAADGLGAQLFELGSLRAPAVLTLSPVAQDDCSRRWLDLQADAPGGSLDGGVMIPDAGPSAADTATAAAPSASGCSVGLPRCASSCCTLAWLFFAYALLLRRVRSRHA